MAGHARLIEDPSGRDSGRRGFDLRTAVWETKGCCRVRTFALDTTMDCRSGGIGRRAWFRSMYSQGCGGSSPPFGTKFPFHMMTS
jgi:hypothetical protein